MKKHTLFTLTILLAGSPAVAQSETISEKALPQQSDAQLESQLTELLELAQVAFPWKSGGVRTMEYSAAEGMYHRAQTIFERSLNAVDPQQRAAWITQQLALMNQHEGAWQPYADDQKTLDTVQQLLERILDKTHALLKRATTPPVTEEELAKAYDAWHTAIMQMNEPIYSVGFRKVPSRQEIAQKAKTQFMDLWNRWEPSNPGMAPAYERYNWIAEREHQISTQLELLQPLQEFAEALRPLVDSSHAAWQQ